MKPSRRLARPTRSLIVGLAALVAAPWLATAPTGCTVNPATGERVVNFISTEQELAIGEEAAPQFLEQGGGHIPDPRIQQYVSDIGQRLAKLSERPDLDWKFHTLDSAIINAFALPGGKVFITRGLLEKMDNEAQLAGVLGHEIGHVTAIHINQRLTQQAIAQGVIAGIGAAASDSDYANLIVAGASVGSQLYMLSFSREQEHQSDTLGLRYMTRAGYDPRGQVQVMRILKAASGGGVEFLQTHPLPQSRIDQLEQHIASKYDYTRNNPKFGLYPDRFKQNVLDRLDKLPPPEQPANEPQ